MNEDAVTRHPWANGEAGEMREGEGEEWFLLKEYLWNWL